MFIEGLKGGKQKFDASIKVVPFFRWPVSFQALFNVVPSPIDLGPSLSVGSPNSPMRLKVVLSPALIEAESTFMSLAAPAFHRVFRRHFVTVFAVLLHIWRIE